MNTPMLIIYLSRIHTTDFFGRVWNVQVLFHEYNNMLSISKDIQFLDTLNSSFIFVNLSLLHFRISNNKGRRQTYVFTLWKIFKKLSIE
jgi:hypothetical protein